MEHGMDGNQAVAGNRGTSEFGDAWTLAAGTPPGGRNKAKCNFILQQGFDEPQPAACPLQYSALTVQPRAVLIAIAAGIVFQSTGLFAALGALLWWNALLPKLNPINALYNRALGRRPGAFRLGPAPAPRRAAERMAGTFSLAIALLIQGGFGIAAYVAEAIFLAAALAVVVGSFCPGSFMFHLLKGRRKFALGTLPWAR